MTNDQPRCPFTWNPGEWPYATVCTLPLDHASDHANEKTGRTHPQVRGLQGIAPEEITQTLMAVERLVDVVMRHASGPALRRERLHHLTITWPSLAARLGDLVALSGHGVPASLRRAQQAVVVDGS